MFRSRTNVTTANPHHSSSNGDHQKRQSSTQSRHVSAPDPQLAQQQLPPLREKAQVDQLTPFLHSSLQIRPPPGPDFSGPAYDATSPSVRNLGSNTYYTVTIPRYDIHAPSPSFTPLPPLFGPMDHEDVKKCAFEFIINILNVARAPPTRSTSASPSKKTGGVSVISDEMKAILGLKSDAGAEGGMHGIPARESGAVVIEPLEAIQRQMKFSDITESRTKKGLSKVSMNLTPPNVIVPLELLYHLSPSDFPSHRDFNQWKKRQLEWLEESLLLSPSVQNRRESKSAVEGPRKGGSAPGYNRMEDGQAMKLREIISKLSIGEMDIQLPEVKALLYETVSTFVDGMEGGSKSSPSPRSSGLWGGSLTAPPPPVRLWADSYPLNIHLYFHLLRCCFLRSDEPFLISELEEVLESVGRTWGPLGINVVMHRALFAWLFFNQFLVSGERETGLIKAAHYQLKVVDEEMDVSSKRSTFKSESESKQCDAILLLQFLLPSMLQYADEKLLKYHETFPNGGSGFMDDLLGIGILSEKMLNSEIIVTLSKKRKSDRGSNGGEVPNRNSWLGVQGKAEFYIRQSVKAAFADLAEAAKERTQAQQSSLSRSSSGLAQASETSNNYIPPPPALVSIAADAGALVVDSLGKYNEVLMPYNSNAGGIAIATVHNCFKRELQNFLSEVSLLSVEAAQVLLQSKKLEKQLIEMSVEEGEEAEDGGALVMKEMTPYQCEETMSELLEKWMINRKVKFNEWVDRALYMEKWEAKSVRDYVGKSAIDLLGLLKESEESFFALPLPPDADLLIRLVTEMEKAMLKYTQSVIATIGPRQALLPPILNVTRFKKDVHQKAGTQALVAAATALAKAIPSSTDDGPPTPGKSSSKKVPLNESLPKILVRMNTLLYVRTELDRLSFSVRSNWEKALAPPASSGGAEAARGGAGLWPLTGGLLMEREGDNIPLMPPLPAELINMFGEVCDEAERGMGLFAGYAAYRIIFQELRAPLLYGLYSGGASKSRVDGVLKKLHTQLVTVVDVCSTERARNLVVAEVCRAFAMGIMLVLLAGGPNRAYMISDAAVIEEDLKVVWNMFFDEGNGLPSDEIRASMHSLHGLLPLLRLDTDSLIKQLEQMYDSHRKSKGRGQVRMPISVTSNPDEIEDVIVRKWGKDDVETVFRILCHRAERPASKYLKKWFDLPKETAAGRPAWQL